MTSGRTAVQPAGSERRATRAIDAYYLSRHQIEKVGGAIHTEYWIPAEDLPEFNWNIVGRIEVTQEFGCIPA
jgi:hypothetical protein